MDQVHVIRHKVLVEGQSVRRVSREMGVSRNTVRKYLRESEPRRRERVSRARPVWAEVGGRIEELLEQWREKIRGGDDCFEEIRSRCGSIGVAGPRTGIGGLALRLSTGQTGSRDARERLPAI